MPDDVKSDDVKMARARQAKMPADDWMANYGALLDGGQHAFSHWLQGMLAVSQEIARFTQSRMQEDMAAWGVLVRCRGPEEAVECQRRFAEKAAEQYGEEFAKLSRMMVEMTSAGLSLPPQK
jgi:hypothetical protein